MAIRHPPDDHVPPAIRRRGVEPPRVVRFEEPRRGLARRILRFFFRPYIIIPAILVAGLAIAILAYYWVVFSGRVDNLLRGEVFTRSAGIYAAPKQIRVGENISEEDLIAYLRRAGYVESSQQADSARGRYSMKGATVDVDPGVDSLVDNARPYPQVRIEFNHTGKAISYLTDRQSGGHLEKAQLEPELISSVTGRERAKRRVIGFNDVPNDLRNAIVVTEDRSFFEHHGVNIRG
ncbi:MAG TPA: transglycosylase domain-containing protein, partial [Pyrinomonadaceae bacterium]|nr:transglycosylase domain-containing protein [Pyrinomonadaceae bacterium]